MVRAKEEAEEFSKTEKLIQEKFIVEYKSELYDVTEFMLKHPGGINTLQGHNGRNIDEKFVHVEHSPAAAYLLKEYKIKKNHDDTGSVFDDSLEYLVDWKTALIPQISKIGDKYADWVSKPVDRQLRLFKNPIIEYLSKTPWYLPLLFWIPIVCFLIQHEIATEKINSHALCLQLIVGVFSWTLIEYSLHRFVFHMDIRKHPSWSTFHFMIHGIHHKVPFDEYRLVFPPAPAAILAIILYQPVQLLNYLFNEDLYNSRLFLSGALIGYLCYDMTHYYIHYGSPENKYFYHLKRYHYNHHFVNHDRGFGISSVLWDVVFDTKIVLRKLKYLLKW